MRAALMTQPQVSDVWPRLTSEQRTEVGIWCEMFRRFTTSSGRKSAEFQRIVYEYEPKLGYEIKQTTFYRKMEAAASDPIVAVLGEAAVRRARGVMKSPVMPPMFVSWIRSKCGDMQRRKFLPVWRDIINNHLRAGKVIPGYDADWRGIWADDHPGRQIPPMCPYNDLVGKWNACQPNGWSYANLIRYAPERDVWAGASVGVHAMRAFNPSVPHTRFGMRPMMAVTMDDVDPDVYCHYRGESEARRPVGLGMLDIATGCMVGFTLVPRIKDPATGVVSGLKAFWARYIMANAFCGIGIDREAGMTCLFEHGTASLTDAEVFRINKMLGPGPITDYPPTQAPNDFKGVWFVVLRSSTSGAPIMKGLFREKAAGIPTWKAPIEALWNRLHNEVSMLPGQSGKDWENAPQHISGWQKEDKDLIEIQNALSSCPQSVEVLKKAQTHALSYEQLNEAFKNAVNALNNRHQHSIQEFDKCGYVNHLVEVGGALVPMDKAAEDLAGDDPQMREIVLAKLAPKQKVSVMSPAEAWASHDKALRKTFDGFIATQILGDELSQVVKVTANNEFFAQNHWSEEWLQYSAMVEQPDGVACVFQAGEKLRVWVNPTNVNMALVCREDGSYVGRARYMAPAPFHRPKDAKVSLGELSKNRAAQMGRLASVVGGRIIREAERRETNYKSVIASAKEATKPLTMGDGESVDVLSLTRNVDATSSSRQESDDPSAEDTDFLSRMNDLSRHV